MHTHIYIRVHTNTHTRTHTHAQRKTHTHKHAQTHTQIHAQRMKKRISKWHTIVDHSTKSLPTWASTSYAGWLVCPHIVGGKFPTWYIVTWTHTNRLQGGLQSHNSVVKYFRYSNPVVKYLRYRNHPLLRIQDYKWFPLLCLEEVRIQLCMLHQLPGILSFWFLNSQFFSASLFLNSLPA